MICSVVDCESPAVTALAFRNQFGHVHVCAKDEAMDREWCDVIDAAPIITDVCPWPCTTSPIYSAEPTQLQP